MPTLFIEAREKAKKSHTIFASAVETGNTSRVNELLNPPQDLIAITKQKLPSDIMSYFLIIAANNRHTDIIKLLLNACADNGIEALCMIAEDTSFPELERKNIAQLLVENGADIKQALFMAAQRGNTEIISNVYNILSKHISARLWNQILLIAAYNGQTSLVSTFLNHLTLSAQHLDKVVTEINLKGHHATAALLKTLKKEPPTQQPQKPPSEISTNVQPKPTTLYIKPLVEPIHQLIIQTHQVFQDN